MDTFQKALNAYEKAWNILKNEKDGESKLLADRALGELMLMNARVGNYESIEKLFKEIKGRKLTGVSTERVTGAREGLWMMKNKPKEAFLCGPYALNQIAVSLKKGDTQKILSYPSTIHGTNLNELSLLSKEAGLNFQMAHRENS